jgi:nitroimidazol reductase NimA-like FMN-containing flavoprotein (pyridoxamine 5'-phosphate oxidase superfamily)
MKSREIVLQSAMEEIIRKCQYCTMAMVDQQNQPYVLPMNFGYADGVVYLHSAPEGKKVDILRNNNRVCLAFSTDHELKHQHEEVACSYSMKYRSVLVYGKVEFIDDPGEKRRVLNILMKQYTGRDDFSYHEPAIKNVLVYQVKAVKMEGRAYGF